MCTIACFATALVHIQRVMVVALLIILSVCLSMDHGPNMEAVNLMGIIV